MEERTKFLECLSKERDTVAQIEREQESLQKELEEVTNKYAEADEALKKVRKTCYGYVNCERK